MQSPSLAAELLAVALAYVSPVGHVGWLGYWVWEEDVADEPNTAAGPSPLAGGKMKRLLNGSLSHLPSKQGAFSCLGQLAPHRVYVRGVPQVGDPKRGAGRLGGKGAELFRWLPLGARPAHRAEHEALPQV